MELYFLTTDDVLQMHVDQIALYGGEPSVRDPGLLKSAVETPRSSFDGVLLHKDIFEMAAAYLYHIVKNHPFVDGNKRTGTVAAMSFLEINGIDVEAEESRVVDVVIAVATGRMAKPDVASFLRDHAVHN